MRYENCGFLGKFTALNYKVLELLKQVDYQDAKILV